MASSEKLRAFLIELTPSRFASAQKRFGEMRYSTWKTAGKRVTPGAFAATLKRWSRSGKMIPVLADHDGVIGSVVGKVDPRMSGESAQGLEVAGVLDTSTELGARVYQLVKEGSLSWSIGYTIPEGGRRKAGRVTELAQIDLAEISVVATPANEGTRTLSIKSEPSVQIVSFEC